MTINQQSVNPLPTHPEWEFPNAEPTPPDNPADGGGTVQHCVVVDWPGKSMWPTMERKSTWYYTESWVGSLLLHSRDPSGQYYRRNRFYDGSSGRFTQEDPIGIAGGLNVYGYANGDPISYSDPYGLTPDCRWYQIGCLLIKVGAALVSQQATPDPELRHGTEWIDADGTSTAARETTTRDLNEAVNSNRRGDGSHSPPEQRSRTRRVTGPRSQVRGRVPNTTVGNNGVFLRGLSPVGMVIDAIHYGKQLEYYRSWEGQCELRATNQFGGDECAE